MNKIVPIALSGLLLFTACKEKEVLIDMGLKDGVVEKTYMGSNETPQVKNVMIEEFTGASCTNCPDGHKAVANIIEANPGRVVAAAYHTFNGGSIFKPVKKPGEVSKYDFRDSAATDIGTIIYGGVSLIPVAGIDRVLEGSSRLIGKTQWALEAGKRLAVETPINLTLTSEYRKDENKIQVKVKVLYNKEVSTKNSLTIGVIENGIIDAQEFADHVDMEYEHEHVLRKFLTPYNGYPVIDSVSVKSPGRIYEFSYVFTPSDTWNLDNCYIFAFVSNNESENKEVLQAQQVKVK